MLVRIIALVELALGGAIASGRALSHLRLHIGLGFTISGLVLLLAIMAAVRKLPLPVILGALFAFLLPYGGVKQLPVRLGAAMDAVQIAHIVIALSTIGVAEFIHAQIRKSTKAEVRS